MRYADGGGVSQAGRAKREQIRRQAAALFASGPSPVELAARLEVSTKSARAWRRAWLAGGEAGLASKGASGPQSKLTVEQLRQLEQRAMRDRAGELGGTCTINSVTGTGTQILASKPGQRSFRTSQRSPGRSWPW